MNQKGYEVISISADEKKKTFEDFAQTLIWEAKSNQPEGFAGDDFLNYGVIGTPTFYLINKKGIIEGRYARVKDMGLEMISLC